MKTITILKTVFAISILIIVNSCSKENTTPSTTNSGSSSSTAGNTKQDGNPGTFEIEYGIFPFNNNVLLVSYTDSAGRQVTTGNYEGFSGTKTITISGNPFHASFKVIVENMHKEDMDFRMTISLNGEIVKFADIRQPAASSDYAIVDSIDYYVPFP